MSRNADPTIYIQALAENLSRIELVARQLSADQLRKAPEPGAWSANEILWHIRATADVYGKHINRILTEDTPAWSHVSPRAQMKKSRYDQLPFADSLAAFQQQRTNLLAQLGNLAPAAWQRTALVRVPYRTDGRDWRLTLHERVWGFADHETGHVREMELAVNALTPGQLANRPARP